MSSDFSISDFRRRRASDNPPPLETGQLPLEIPVPTQTGPQEFVPQVASPAIPDAVPNTYVNTSPPNTYAQVGVYGESVTPPTVYQQAATPLPLPISAPMLKTEKPKSKSLIGGLLGRFKKTSNPQVQPRTVAGGPVEFAPMPAADLYQTEPDQNSSLRAAVPVKASAVDTVTEPKAKIRLPAWAAFLLGIMAGIILTFAGLALLAGQAGNSLEARFSDISKTVQSAEVVTEDTVEVAEAPEGTDPLD